MTLDAPAPDSRRFAVDGFRSHWILFVLVGGFFMVGGLVAMTVPARTAIAHNEVLGMVLLLTGMVEIVQAGRMQRTGLFAFCLGLGVVAVIGGVFVYIEPFKDVRVKMAIMSLVFAQHGLVQVALALKVRQVRGWGWLVAAGIVSLAVAVLLEMDLPYNRAFTPSTVGGVSLVLTGWSYIAVALVARRS
jgi:uncharacterized membrane protein HdeD (DUF308 family)